MGLRDPLSTEEVAKRLGEFDGWTLSADPPTVRKVFPIEYYAAIKALGDVADAAKELEHHPDVELHWGELAFSMTTYSAGQRITELDFLLVEQIEQVMKRYPAANQQAVIEPGRA